MRRIIVISSLLFLCSSLFAQTDEDISNFIKNGIYAEKEGDLNNAIFYFEQSKDGLEKLKKTAENIYIIISYKLAKCYSCKGDLANVEKNLKTGSKVLELLKEDDPKFWVFAHNLADCYYTIGNYLRAIEISKKALEICKEIKGETNPDYLSLLINIAHYYCKNGDYSIAIEYYTKEQNLIRMTNGENNPDYATSLNHLANCYSDIGDYPHAIEYGTKTLEIRKSVLGENHPDYAQTLSNLTTYCNYLHDYPRAIEYGTKALEILKSMLGERNTGYATSLNNLAYGYFGIGNYSKAIELGTKALEIEKEVVGENSNSCAFYLNNLALYNSFEGNNTKAIELCTEALEICKSTNGEQSPEYSTLLSNLALYFSYLGDYYNAKEIGIKALDIRRKVTGENHPEYAALLRFIAICDLFSGNMSQALDNIMTSVSLSQSNILRFFSSLNSHERAIYWGNCSYAFTDMYPSISYLSLSHNVSDLYNKSALFSKNLLLTTGIELDRLIKESGDEDALKMIDELHNQRLQLLKLYETPKEKRLINVDSLAQVADLLENKLVKQSNVYGDFTKKMNTTWQNIQDCLSEDEIAVEFLSFNVEGTDSTMVAALTLRKDDKEPKFFPLFELRQLKELSDTIHFICPDLTSLVWQPLHDEIQGIKTIYFSPAGVLHKIGIEYAPGMESYEMFRLSSTREIIDMKATQKAKEDIISARLYGGINYESSNPMDSVENKIVSDTSLKNSISKHRAMIDSLDLRGIQIGYLPGTLREVQNIEKTFADKHYNATSYTGANATETSVKSLSGKDTGILHISTHGFYYTESQAKKKEKLLFLTFDDKHHTNYEDKTLTRSGLLMAGAKLTIDGKDMPMDSDDGILTAQEISMLDLRGTDLVVLSACETARGDIMQGEGVFGLQRGFKKAGAKSILMSLWKVSDVSTEILMTEFYKNLCEGKSKRESLRLAQKMVREYKDDEGNLLFQNPHYWAGFILLD